MYANESLVYSRDELLRLRSTASNWPTVPYHPGPYSFNPSVRGLTKYRRSRAGKQVKERRKASNKNIQTLFTHQRAPIETQRSRNYSNLITIEPVRNAPSSLQGSSLPVILTTNVRSLMPKVDELDLITQTNLVDIAAVTETAWLTDAVPDSALNITNFNLFKKG